MKLKPQAIEAARLAAKQWIAMPSMNISRRAQEMRSLATVLRALGDDATASALEQRLAMEAAGTGGIDTLISEEAMMEKIENRKSP